MKARNGLKYAGIGGGSSSKSSRHKHKCYDGDYSHMPKSRWRKKYEAKMNGVQDVEEAEENKEAE